MPDLSNILAFVAARPVYFILSFWGSVTLLALIAVTLIYLIFLRLTHLVESRREQATLRKWEPILKRLREGREPDELPTISRQRRKIFLEMWLRQRESATSAYAEALDGLAQRVNMKAMLLAILRPGNLEFLPRLVWLQAVAISAAIYVRSTEVNRLVMEMADSENEYLAVQACACLAQLKVPGFERKIISIMFRFPGEAPGIFDKVSVAGGADVLHVMQAFLPRLPRHTVMNFISLAEKSGDASLLPVLQNRLANSGNEEEIAALLRTIGRLGDTAQREVILPYLQHTRTFVRIQAAKAVGRVGKPADRDLLMPLLRDPDWWLRYRAARAIIKLSNFNSEDIDRLRDAEQDRYANEILLHAQHELEWHLT